jgi:hypothetical protein
MNGLPDPYHLRDRVTVAGKSYIVSDRAPNSDGWRYIGTPVDLTGMEIHFSHEEVQAVVSATLPPTGRDMFRQAGLDPERFDAELSVEEQTPERNVITALALWCHGRLSSADLRETYLLFTEGQTT